MRISYWSSDVCSSDLAPYATVPSGQNGTGLSPSDFAGNISTGSQVLKFKNAERIQSLLLNGSYRVGKNTEVFMDVVHSKRSIPARELQLMVLAGQYGISGTVVSSDNPFNPFGADVGIRSEEHTSELKSLLRISYAAFCMK